MIFEKIKERLQKLCEQTYYNSVNGDRDEGIRNNVYHNAIDIINQVEAEYNNGWIPCSEKLPDIEADVLLILRSFDIYTGFRANTDGYFYVEGTDDCYIPFDNVIAWQPLPGPFKESD